ncbi:hypothetical protein TNCV_2998611 [Trichonephila clavipes]|nr:hypothetical protein TNCV_2998611 [Trichonephila clavipes]
MAKILVFGTDGAQIESSSFIGDPGHANRTAPFTLSSRGAIYPPQKQPSRQTHDAISRHTTKPSHTHDATQTSRPARMTQLLTRSPRIWYEYDIVRSPIHRITGMGVVWRCDIDINQ